MAPKIQLWHTQGLCSLIQLILLEEAGLPYELKVLPFGDSPAKEEFKKNVNPKGQVPTLILDNEVITEGVAIQTAISQLAPGNKFFGSTPLETVRVYEWLNFLSGTIHSKALIFQILPATVTTTGEGLEGIKARGEQIWRDAFQLFDRKLAECQAAGKQHLVGDGLTGADLYVWLFWHWSFNFKVPAGDVPHVKAFVEYLEQRPSIKKVWELDGKLTSNNAPNLNQNGRAKL